MNKEFSEEKPLEKIVPDGGFTTILRCIGYIGDSLAAGEFEGVASNGCTTYHDMYQHSWGSYIGRASHTVSHVSARGGMMASVFIDDPIYWPYEKFRECNAFVIALGVNDLLNYGQELGSLDDINKEEWWNTKSTYIGSMAKIIYKLKSIQPRAKFFLVTIPRYSTDLTDSREKQAESQAKAMYDLAGYFDNTYVIDIRKYGPVYDEEFKEMYFMGGHMNPMGYKFTADMIMSYIDYIIRHNYKDFKEVGFIGTDFHHYKD